MSLASRQREVERRRLHQRRGHPTWESYWDAQCAARSDALIRGSYPPDTTSLARGANGRPFHPPITFAALMAGPSDPMTFPDPST